MILDSDGNPVKGQEPSADMMAMMRASMEGRVKAEIAEIGASPAAAGLGYTLAEGIMAALRRQAPGVAAALGVNDKADFEAGTSVAMAIIYHSDRAYHEFFGRAGAPPQDR